jgi:hypothetical protein
MKNKENLPTDNTGGLLVPPERWKKKTKTPNHSVQGKKYRVTYTTCTDIINDFVAESETEAKAMFCQQQGLPIKDFIHKLKAKKLK